MRNNSRQTNRATELGKKQTSGECVNHSIGDNNNSPRVANNSKELFRLAKSDNILSLREQIADLEHKQWQHWTKYFLDNLEDHYKVKKSNKQRWERQCHDLYANLSEKEKKSDRKWADKVLQIVFNKIKEIQRDNSNPCMKCGSIQCALCSDDLIKLFNEDYNVRE